MIQECSAREFHSVLCTFNSPSEFQLLDVRSNAEFIIGHLKNARNLSAREKTLQKMLDSLDKTLPCLVYCHSGIYSRRIAQYLSHSGFFHIYHLSGGLADWTRQGLDLDY